MKKRKRKKNFQKSLKRATRKELFYGPEIENSFLARYDAGKKPLAQKNCQEINFFQFNINPNGHSARLSILPTLMTNIYQ